MIRTIFCVIMILCILSSVLCEGKVIKIQNGKDYYFKCVIEVNDFEKMIVLSQNELRDIYVERLLNRIKVKLEPNDQAFYFYWLKKDESIWNLNDEKIVHLYGNGEDKNLIMAYYTAINSNIKLSLIDMMAQSIVVAGGITPEVDSVIKVIDLAYRYKGPEISGTSVSLAAPSKWIARGILAAIPEFERKTSAKTQVIIISYPELLAKMIATHKAGISLSDIVIMPLEERGMLLSSDILEPLDNYIGDKNLSAPFFEINDFYKPLLEGFRGTDGKLYGLPLKPDVPIYYYRKDLFANNGERREYRKKYGYELKPAQTLDEYLDIAKFFKRPEDGLYGSAIPETNWAIFNYWGSRFLSMGGRFFDENLFARINSPIGIRTMESFLKEAKFSFQGTTSEIYKMILEGHIAQFIGGLGVFKLATDLPPGLIETQHKAEIGYAPFPASLKGEPSRVLLGGWWIGISKRAKNKVAAFKLIEWLTSKKGELYRIAGGQYPARMSNINEFQNSFLQILPKAYQDSIILPVDVQNWRELRDLGAGNFLEVIRGKKAPEMALHDLAITWNKTAKAFK